MISYRWGGVELIRFMFMFFQRSSTKWHTKAALEWVELCKMSCERWVVWDELCDFWDERSCVGWVLWVVWDNLGEVERERSNSGGEGEGKEYKPKSKSPTQRCEEKNITWWVVWWCLKQTRRRIMLQRHNDKITQQKRAQTTNRLTCTNDPLWRAQTTPRRNISWMFLPVLRLRDPIEVTTMRLHRMSIFSH